MATQPQVTVIIPVHNRRAYLQRCLAALAGQSYQHLQVIVGDDASSEDIQASVAAVAWPGVMLVAALLRSIKQSRKTLHFMPRKKMC